MDTHHTHLQDPLTMDRINVRCRTAAPRSTMFLRFDAARIEWLAAELEDADRPEHARLARQWVEELRASADRIEAQDALDEIGGAA